MNESSKESTTTATRLLSTAESVELLDQLRQSIRDLTARAGELERDFAARSHKLRAQFDHAIAGETARLAAKTESANAAVAAERARAESIFNARKLRISKAFENSRKRKLAEIEGEEGRRTFEIQRGLLEADRTRETDTASNKKNHEIFIANLAAEHAVLDQLSARARSTLGGYRSLARWLKTPPASPALDVSEHENQLIDQLRERRDKTKRELARCRRLVLPLLFRYCPWWLCSLLILAVSFAFVPELRRFDFAAVPKNVWEIVGAALGVVIALYFLGRQLAAAHARIAAIALSEARKLHEVCAQKTDASFAQESGRTQTTHANTTQSLNRQWKQIQAEAKSLRTDLAQRLAEHAGRLNLMNEGRRTHNSARLEQSDAGRSAQLSEQSAARQKQIETTQADGIGKVGVAFEASRQAIQNQWQLKVLPVYETLRTSGADVAKIFPAWRPELWQGFATPDTFQRTAKFGELAVDVEKLCEISLPANVGQTSGLPVAKPPASSSRTGQPEVALTGRLEVCPTRFTVPLVLSVPKQASILFETKNSGHEQIIGALNNLVLRLLTSAPPGRLAFTIFDPVGLGQNFAGIMHLADFEERLINGRIWTQQPQFEQRLADLNEHIEKVTQMYLRNEYETLAEYNAQAGRMAEKYHFLVIADFPANFSDVAVKRLQSIAASGPRCGVHLLIHWDQRKPAPVEFVPEELRKNSICIVPKGDGFALAAANWDGLKLTLDSPPAAELSTQLLQQIGKDSTDSYRVEMPFDEVAPAESEMWSLDTTSELRVPVGRTGATKLQYLALGQGTRQHGLIAGKTGSGKSTLFHVAITNLALWCSPEQVEFYLVDFKKGVEFKCYATHRLPHARVIAIESDREFGLSVLQRVDEELKRRGDLFRKLGAQDIAGYKRASGPEAIPRTLLLIDEFQELFVEDDRISQGAALLLDRIVRQGRAFGIHVLLGSQTLGGAYSLARATIGQMVVRIALQCNEADALLIMNEDNPAPRLLSRPGEAIYNDDGGSIQGNSPFQVVWLPDQVRDEWLNKVSKFAKRYYIPGERTHPQPLQGGEQVEVRAKAVPLLGGVRGGFAGRDPIIFEGNAPASVRENPVLRSLLEADSIRSAATARVWLGAPNSIKGPTEAVFHRQSGSHLLIVGQREEAALGMLAVAMVALAAQRPKEAARFLVFDCSAPDSAEARFLERAVRAIPHPVKLVRAAEVEEVMAALASEQQEQADQPGAAGPETYLLVHGLQRNKKLRFDEEMSFSLDAGGGANPGLQLNKLICEGAGLGFHVIATCDSYNNVMRMLSRKAVSEFEMRVVFQMSANDSASLIDSPQANSLGLHRAILFNGQEGWLETFRPYALPDEAWLAEAGRKLTQLATAG